MTTTQLALRIVMESDRVKSATDSHGFHPDCGMTIGRFMSAAFTPDASVLVNRMDLDIVRSTYEAVRAEAIDDRW